MIWVSRENIILLNSNHTITLFHNNNFITGSTDFCLKTKRICRKRPEEKERGLRGREGGGRGEERKRRQYDYENLLQKVMVF